MNKLSIGLLLAAGLFFIDVSPAAAHRVSDESRMYGNAHHYNQDRRHEMPRRYKRNKQFRHWYRRSPLKRYRQISWNQLFEIYRWERRYFTDRRYNAYGDVRPQDRRYGRNRNNY